MNELMINRKKERIDICMAENGKICEVYTYDQNDINIMGNIYLGKVKDVVDGIQAAFVDIGMEKNAFISTKDALPKVDVVKEEKVIEKKISEVVKEGDKILVQVKKIATGEKGARVSTHVTLPGNYVVLMPNTEILTISQKIASEEEKSRLMQIVKKSLPSGFGVIVRTDASNISKEKIQEDINDLLKKWKNILTAYEEKQEAALLYNEHELISKISRDLINQQTKKVYVNDTNIYNMMNSYALRKNIKIELVETDDIIKELGFSGDIEDIKKRKVWLKCGGYIVIDRTEALTAIDVNSGKYLGNQNLEQTALNVNIEAAREIMKQIRLRDLGGIIIIDYIDLDKKEDQMKIVDIMREEAKKDRSKTDIKGYTELNLVELTRKKMNI